MMFFFRVFIIMFLKNARRAIFSFSVTYIIIYIYIYIYIYVYKRNDNLMSRNANDPH